MHLPSSAALLRASNGPLRCPKRFVDAIMLNRAVNRYASSSQGEKKQSPLRLNSAAANVITDPPTNNLKRKFDRTMSTTSSLGSLHQHTSFDENSPPGPFIDLRSPEKGSDIRYPSLDTLDCEYPNLPAVPLESSQPTSSAQVPWSSSPESHYANPPARTEPQEPSSPVPAKPAKRRVLPASFTSSNSTTAGSRADNEQFVKKAHNEHNGRFDKFSAAKQFTSASGLDKASAAMSNMLQKAPVARQRSNTPILRASSDRNVQSTIKSAETQNSTLERVPETFLSDEQKAVMKTVMEEGKSVFFTGSAGTGKSVLMRAIISQLKHKYRKEPDRIAITASTGLASCILEGQTLHSWSGIGLGKEPAPELVKKIKRNQKSRQKWLRTKVLIIDEISMVDGQLFDKLEQVARTLRNNGRPFGGIQLVVTGDFFQLPPVPDKNSTAKFVFDAVTWNTCIEHTILLTHVFRQKDEQFARMLNEMRLGRMSAATIREFKSLSRPLDFHDELEATEL